MPSVSIMSCGALAIAKKASSVAPAWPTKAVATNAMTRSPARANMTGTASRAIARA